jgi:hypothetical protein
LRCQWRLRSSCIEPRLSSLQLFSSAQWLSVLRSFCLLAIKLPVIRGSFILSELSGISEQSWGQITQARRSQGGQRCARTAPWTWSSFRGPPLSFLETCCYFASYFRSYELTNQSFWRFGSSEQSPCLYIGWSHSSCPPLQGPLLSIQAYLNSHAHWVSDRVKSKDPKERACLLSLDFWSH